MTQIKINGTLYPATISGKLIDNEWDGRNSKSIKLEMDYETAVAMFVDGLAWSIVMTNVVPVARLDDNGEPVLDENGEAIYDIVEQTEEYDNSDYCVAGDITDHRDGTFTVKLGKLTELEEAYEMMFGGIE